MSRRTLGAALALSLMLAACTSPEASRMRAGGPGADPGNRRDVVRLHDGADPYWRTPRLLSDLPSTREAPAASPR